MILPIVAYGDPVLKKEADEIEESYPKLKELIENMFETMNGAQGVGLAAPQVGFSIRLFIVDTSPFAEMDEDEEQDESEEELAKLKGFKKVFINPIILDEEGLNWKFNEGCLSIPGVREEVSRQPELTIEYFDENFELKEEKYDGLIARVIQHEYDHVDGVLFTDHLNPIKKKFLKKKLDNISKGIVDVDYKMKFPKKR
ncbi:MAG: peptide deformylase [Flavobacteriales bacterium]|jgi:peptide deformylase|nr:peptide deformylase [Flavobacteriales bacterium]NCG31119.1 peptide deformylase [Bacteroidota bacterium]MBT3963807.1 peptide deformylase [Flavobacteriales bacterium]MBT4705412.1 peptide deformylase [Flavobacteriales bacterium]MBT4929837.1 peptide deformylase [Flavobacteriales bacterium]